MQVIFDIYQGIGFFSVGEAFIDMTRCQLLYGLARRIGRLLKQAVRQATGLNLVKRLKWYGFRDIQDEFAQHMDHREHGGLSE